MTTSFKDMTLTEVLDDLTSRFIINVPTSELASIERICFQIEQAHWYYLDYVRLENPSLPPISLKSFCGQNTYFLSFFLSCLLSFFFDSETLSCLLPLMDLLISFFIFRIFSLLFLMVLLFKQCPLLHAWASNHEAAFADFMKYKLQVPVCGGIILNPTLDKILLVKGWKSKSWSFPKGKINQNEKEVDCAIREVLEETGLDITPHLIITNYLPKAPTASKQEPDHIETIIRECRMRLYFAIDVPESTRFQTQTMNEISDITWHSLASIYQLHSSSSSSSFSSSFSFSSRMKPSSVPSKSNLYYSMAPFLDGIQSWIQQHQHALHPLKVPVYHHRSQHPQTQETQSQEREEKEEKERVLNTSSSVSSTSSSSSSSSSLSTHTTTAATLTQKLKTTLLSLPSTSLNGSTSSNHATHVSSSTSLHIPLTTTTSSSKFTPTFHPSPVNDPSSSLSTFPLIHPTSSSASDKSRSSLTPMQQQRCTKFILSPQVIQVWTQFKFDRAKILACFEG